VLSVESFPGDKGKMSYANYEVFGLDELVVEDGIENATTELAGCTGEGYHFETECEIGFVSEERDMSGVAVMLLSRLEVWMFKTLIRQSNF
jgi:hypothetical protein